MKPRSWLIPLAIVVVSMSLGAHLIANSLANQKSKSDYAELNHVRYGLFSINEWKRQVTALLAAEINKLYLSTTNEQELRKKIEAQMTTLIDEVDRKIRQGHAGTAKGWIKQTFIDLVVSLDDIKKGIPRYTDTLMHELTRAKTTDQIKAILNAQLALYLNETFDTQDTSHLNRILRSTGSTDIAAARLKLAAAISVRHTVIHRESLLLIVLSALLFGLSWRSTGPLAPSRFLLLLLSLVTLLIVGVTTPMIDMEAKISQMSFVLLGHPIHFENQVLYFQSKSILDVFWIMITHKDLQMKLVGVLVVTFSVFFPLLKMAAALVSSFNYRQLREHPAIRFFVFKSGKWSMADVMVVAIFMAYIGFNGIITSQLGQLSTAAQELVIVTTNGTSLQPGYYLFFTYTLLALLFSGFLARVPPATDAADTPGGAS